MKEAFYAILAILLVSCEANVAHCSLHKKGDIDDFQKFIDREIEYPNIKLISAKNYNEFIQFQGKDSWGWFAHTIRIVSFDKGYLMQMIDSRRPGIGIDKINMYKEKILSKEEWNTIKTYTEDLYCNKIHLEQNIHGVDGNYYDLVLKDNDKLQVFHWQMIVEEKDAENIKILKSKIARLVGEMMNICEFPNGRKLVLPNDNSITLDSIDYDIFLMNQFNLLEYEITYNGQTIDQTRDGVGVIRVALEDTVNIKDRIIVNTTLLDGSIIRL